MTSGVCMGKCVMGKNPSGDTGYPLSVCDVTPEAVPRLATWRGKPRDVWRGASLHVTMATAWETPGVGGRLGDSHLHNPMPAAAPLPRTHYLHQTMIKLVTFNGVTIFCFERNVIKSFKKGNVICAPQK